MKGKGQFWGFFPIDNVLYSIAFGIYITTSEPIELPFGVMSGLGPRNSMLHGGDNPQREGAILEENMPRKPNTTMNYELDWCMQWHAQFVHTAHDRGRRLIARVG